MRTCTFKIVALLAALLAVCNEGQSQTWDFTGWTGSNLQSEHYYLSDGTSVTTSPESEFHKYLYVDVTDVVTYTSETSEQEFYVQKNTRAKLYGGTSESDASAENGYQPTKNYLCVSVPVGYQITVVGKAGNSGNTLNLSLNGENVQVTDLSKNQTISLTNSSGEEVPAYIYSAGKGQNRSNYAALVVRISLRDTNTPKHQYAVRAVTPEGEVLRDSLQTGWADEDTEYTVSGLPWVLKGDDGSYYVLNATLTNYSASFHMGSEAQTHDIVYTKDETIAYYAEAEELSAGKSAGNYSGGYVASIPAGTSVGIGTLPAGNYILTVASKEEQRVALMHESALFANSEGGLIDVKKNGTWSQPFTLAQETGLKVAGKLHTNGNWASAKFDYLLVRYDGQLHDTAIVLSKKVATFSSTYNLDFSQVSGVKVYVGDMGSGNLSMTRVSVLPANTGAMITADSDGETTIRPVILKSLSYVLDSDLKAILSTMSFADIDSFAASNGYLAYCYDDGQAAFVRITEDMEGEAGAGGAYLQVGQEEEQAVIGADFSAYSMPGHWERGYQNRALWACQTTEGNTFVSWRAREVDNDGTQYSLYRNNTLVSTFTDRNNITVEGTSQSYPTDFYRLEVLQDGAVSETMELPAGSVKPRNWFRIRLAEEPEVTNTGVMWNAEGVDDGYKVRYTPHDMSSFDMDGDGEEELIVKWEPSNAQDNGYSGYTANVYIDCYKMSQSAAEKSNDYESTLMWRINLGQNIRAGAHYTQFLCYDFDGDGKGEMMVKTSLGTKDGKGDYVFQSRIKERNLDVTRDYTRLDDSGNSQKSNGHIGVGEEWLTVFDGTTGEELATIDYYPKFSISDWTEGSASNKYNKGTRFKACVAMLDGIHPSGVFNRGYYTQSFFTAYNWNGKNLYEVWRHASESAGDGLYGEGAHSLVVGDFDGDGKDEIGVGAAALDDDGSLLWRSGYAHGDALHLGDFDPNNEGMEIFLVNEEYKISDMSTILFDAATGKVLQGHAQFGVDTGRGLAAHVSAAHDGAQLFSRGDGDKTGESYLVQYLDGTPDWVGGSGDYGWSNGSLTKSFKGTDEFGNAISNDVASFPNFRIYWDGDLYDEWMDSRHADKFNDSTKTFERLFTFDTAIHPARSTGGTKEVPNLQTDLFGDWREEVIFHDCDTVSVETKAVTSKTDGEMTIEWPVLQHYLVVFTTTTPTAHLMPWLRDDHVYDMAIAWQNVGYNQPPHLSFDPAVKYKAAAIRHTAYGQDADDASASDSSIYNLCGQKVAETDGKGLSGIGLPKGIYIYKGKKLIIK